MLYIYRSCLIPAGQLPLPAKLSKIYGFSWGRCLQSIWQLGNPKYFSRLKWWRDAFHLGLKEHYEWIHVKNHPGRSSPPPWQRTALEVQCCSVCPEHSAVTCANSALELNWGSVWSNISFNSHMLTVLPFQVVNFSHMASNPPISTCSICNFIHLHHFFQGAYPSK